jgi:hypothetical protein
MWWCSLSHISDDIEKYNATTGVVEQAVESGNEITSEMSESR